MLEVPEQFNRNHPSVRALGDPADTGLMLINYMCQRIGVADLAGLDILDLGCGVRFSQSIINRNVPIRTYTGLEVNREIVDFLKENVSDPRLTYYHVDIANQLYNPGGGEQTFAALSQVGDASYDIACMFSVITHQRPDEAVRTFEFLQKVLKPDGDLFFSALMHDGDPAYEERDPDKPGLLSSYSSAYLTKILDNTNWAVISVEGPYPNGVPIQTSFHCRRKMSGESVDRSHRII